MSSNCVHDATFLAPAATPHRANTAVHPNMVIHAGASVRASRRVGTAVGVAILASTILAYVTTAAAASPPRPRTPAPPVTRIETVVDIVHGVEITD
ncbi:hypothetical protein K8S17_03340, partial [bacterium]|nr:hypothetical protein [bacterium]